MARTPRIPNRSWVRLADHISQHDPLYLRMVGEEGKVLDSSELFGELVYVVDFLIGYTAIIPEYNLVLVKKHVRKHGKKKKKKIQRDT